MSGGGGQASTSPNYPKWAKKELKFGAQETRRLYDERKPPPSLYLPMDDRRRTFLEGAQGQIVDPAMEEYRKTLSGEYLGNTSPYLDTVINRSMQDVQGQVGGNYGASGRFGGGQWAASLADAMTGTSAGLRDRNYQLERDRMGAMAGDAEKYLGLGEYVGGAFEEDAALQAEETMRQYRAPEEQLNEMLSRLYGSPPVANPGMKVPKKHTWDDGWLSGLLGGLI